MLLRGCSDEYVPVEVSESESCTSGEDEQEKEYEGDTSPSPVEMARTPSRSVCQIQFASLLSFLFLFSEDQNDSHHSYDSSIYTQVGVQVKDTVHFTAVHPQCRS